MTNTTNTTNVTSNLTEYQINMLAEIISGMNSSDLKGLSDVINDVAKKMEKEDVKSSKKEARDKKRAERKAKRAERKAARKAKREARKAERKAKKEAKKSSKEEAKEVQSFLLEQQELLKNINEVLDLIDGKEEEMYQAIKAGGFDPLMFDDLTEIIDLLDA